ncbi:MAG: efflux RND transporter periplasmic adaptor subunit [Sphingobacteriaceae bacterium]|nr:MAG: efflux RND transporter periplasmic adaptor subunit [Sphingobacteriaceae bacterium]
MKNLRSIYLLLGLSAGALITGCISNGQTKDTTTEEVAQFPVITLGTKDTILRSTYVADIQAVKNIEIRSRVKGFLEKIYVDEGKAVSAGQPLFKLNDQEYKVMLSRAQAALSNAEAAAKGSELEVERVKLLVDKKVISKSELEVAKAKLNGDKANIEEAKAEVQSAKNHIAYTLIRAPFAGVLNRIPLKAGSLIDEGTLLTSLSDISSMFAYFSFPETEYLQYERTKNTSPDKGNNEVKLALSDGSEYTHPGAIETVDGQIEQTTGSIDFRARFPNPKKLLKHGATGRIYIEHKANDVVLVPQQSVFNIQDKNYVYIVDASNKLKMREFIPSTRLAHFYVVKEGLKAGDKILFEGAQNAREGMIIKPKQVSAEKAMLAMKQ